jgi:hypothetical protein
MGKRWLAVVVLLENGVRERKFFTGYLRAVFHLPARHRATLLMCRQRLNSVPPVMQSVPKAHVCFCNNPNATIISALEFI